MQDTSQKLFKNGIFNSLSFFVNSVIAVLITPYLILKLGTEGFGIYALLIGLMGYYGLLDLGFNRAITKFTAEYKAKKDNVSLQKIISSALITQFGIGLLGSLILWVFTRDIINLLNISEQYNSQAFYSIKISVFAFFLSMLANSLTACINGFQRYDISSILNIGYNLFLNVSIIIILFWQNNLIAIITIHFIFSFLYFAVNIFILIFTLKINPISLRYSYSFIKKIFNYSILVFFSQLPTVFGTYIIRFIIGIYAGPQAVSYFVVPQRIIKAFHGLIQNGFQVIFPFASQLGAEKKIAKLKKLFVDGSKLYSGIAAPVYFFVAIFSYQILYIWLGEEFATNSSKILIILCFFYMFNSSTFVPITISYSINKVKIITIFSWITFTLLSIFAILFVSSYGEIGAAFSLLISVVPGLILASIIAQKIMDLNYISYILKVQGIHIVFGVILLIIFYYFNLQQQSLLFILSSTICFLVYGFLLIKRKYIPVVLLYKNFLSLFQKTNQ